MRPRGLSALDGNDTLSFEDHGASVTGPEGRHLDLARLHADTIEGGIFSIFGPPGRGRSP